MVINGFQKLTLLDFPGKTACTVFTAGCNFRCPFCHNASLVTHIDNRNNINDEEIFSYIEKRRGILEGVCITGGEPLLQNDIEDFIKRIKDLGYAVKLDTNGSRPELLKSLVNKGLVDYVAMDIKNSFEKYSETVGICGFDIRCIEESIDFLLSGVVPFEFRTTVCEELHTAEDIGKIAGRIAGAPKYFIQNFKDSGDIIGKGLTPVSKEKIINMCKTAEKEGIIAQNR